MPEPSVTLIIGPPASGKTNRCLQRLRDRRAAHPLLRARVLLPDRSQIFAFQRQLAAAGGGLGVQISTFGELHHDLLQHSGRLLPLAGESALFRVIQTLVRQAAQAGELPHYAAIVNTPGFINALADRFAELKRERVLPEKFRSLADPAVQGESELALLYDRYQRHLQQQGWADREGQAWLAVEMLQADPAFQPDFELLLLDGFNEFTPVQIALLRALRTRLPEMVITLTGAPGEPRAVHGRFNRARYRLEHDLQPQVEFLSDPPRLTPPLAALESGFYEAAPQPYPQASAEVHLLELRSPAEEAREALRWLKALLLRAPGLQPYQTAIFSPDINLHLSHLKTIAAEFGLPLHSRQRQPLFERPEIQALAGLLELPLAGLPRRLTLETVRSPFFNLQSFGLQRSDAGFLEKLSYDYLVVGGREQWRQAFAAARTRSRDEANPQHALLEDSLEALLPDLPEAADIERIQPAFEHLFVDFLQPPETGSLAGWIAWLQSTLAALQFGQQAPAAVLESLQAVFDQMLLSEELLPGSQPGIPLSYAQFVQELLAALQGQGVQPDFFPQDQGIFIGPVIEARGLRFEAVAVLGLSEGIFPAVERADPFLGEALRARLGMETRLGRFQSSLFYQAALRSSRRLLLTRPYLAEGGEPWQPSPYWQSVSEIFPANIARLRPADLRQLAQAASPAEALFWLARSRPAQPEPALAADLDLRADAVAHKARVLAARTAKKAGGPYEGQPVDIQEALARHFHPDYLWSASRFEAYGSCPQRFYAQYALNLKPLTPPTPGYDPAHLGSLLHELLEKAYRTASPADEPQAVIEALQRVAPEIFSRAPREYGFRPGPLWEIEQAQLLEMLEVNIHALAASSRDWQPTAFEARFGLEDEPALALDTPAGRVLLRGLIDRIDTGPGGGVRVIDYKTGSSHLAKNDLLEGLRLQLPIYAAAARMLGLGEPVDGFYWHLGGAQAGSLKLASFEADGYDTGFTGALQAVVDHLHASLEGLRQADFTPQPPGGGCPSYCPAAAWCWRYDSRPW